MLSYLRGAFVLLFVALPLIEIAVLIKVGQAIGFWPTMLLLIAAAVLGSFVIRERGLSAASRAFEVMREGRIPIAPMLDSYVVIMAGLLLIIPGLVSDVIGLLLLVPRCGAGASAAWCRSSTIIPLSPGATAGLSRAGRP